jgi:CubicO group peptidase (beta-lactamase class C family)
MAKLKCLFLLPLIFMVSSVMGTPLDAQKNNLLLKSSLNRDSKSLKFLKLQSFLENLVPQYVGTGTNPDNLPKSPAAILVVVTPDASAILSFGKLLNGNPPTSKDLFPLSSISKLITGLIAADGVINHDFQLNTPLKSMIRGPLSSGLKNETLGDTLTHFASFRNLPSNLTVNTQNEYAPGERYDYHSLEKALLQNNVSRVPYPIGSNYLYSSLGIGIAGLALLDFYDVPRGVSTPFAESLDALLNREQGLVKSLNLKSTRAFAIEAGDSTNPNIVRGMTSKDISVPASDMGVLGASGSILSNGEDMQKLLEMLLRPQGKWKKIVTEATRPLKSLKEPGSSIGYSIDIKVKQGMTLLAKAGSQAGFSSIMIWNKETGVGFVALSNRGKITTSLANMLIQSHSKAKEIYLKGQMLGETHQ